MKNLISLLICACSVTYAQDAATKSAQLWLGGNIAWSQVADQNTIDLGLRIAWLPVPSCATGVWGSTLMSNVNNRYGSLPQTVGYDEFGLFVEPALFTGHRMQIGFPLLAGLGNIDVAATDLPDNQTTGWFRVLDAGVVLEMPVSTIFHAGISAGYRYVFGLDTRGLQSKDLNTIHIGTLLKWGNFGD